MVCVVCGLPLEQISHEVRWCPMCGAYAIPDRTGEAVWREPKVLEEVRAQFGFGTITPAQMSEPPVEKPVATFNRMMATEHALDWLRKAGGADLRRMLGMQALDDLAAFLLEEKALPGVKITDRDGAEWAAMMLAQRYRKLASENGCTIAGLVIATLVPDDPALFQLTFTVGVRSITYIWASDRIIMGDCSVTTSLTNSPYSVVYRFFNRAPTP